MKRKPKHHWREKLSAKGLEYLDDYRRQKLEAQADQRETGSINFLKEFEIRLAASSRSTGSRKTLDDFKEQSPEAVAMAETCLRELRSRFLSLSMPELWNQISRLLETGGQQGRKAIAFGLAVVGHGILDAYRDARRRHFGDIEINDRESLWVLGTALETVGNTLRTGDLTPTTKGRANIELVDMIRIIRKHEKNKLTYRDLKAALEYVLIPVADEESLRVFVHRYKKRGLL
jgi:hypothetical protein